MIYALHLGMHPGAVLVQMARFGLGAALYTTGLGVLLSLLLSIRIDEGIHLDARRLLG